MSYQITHVVPDGADPDRRIDAVYGPSCSYLLEDQAIAMIDKGASFHTFEGGVGARVYVAGNSLSRRWLTTSADGYGPNNLCKLPRYNALLGAIMATRLRPAG